MSSLSACSSSVGSGRHLGCTFSANSASTCASIASVFARIPRARAKSRTCRGLTTATGSPAVANDAAKRVSYPPVASITMFVGLSAAKRSTVFGNSVEVASTVQLSPDGRTLMSIVSFAMSIPINTFFNASFPSLRMRAFYAQATVRDYSAISSEDHANRRSLLTMGESISHPTPGATPR